MRNYLRETVLIWSSILFFVIAITLHHHNPKPQIQIVKQESALNINIGIMKFMAIGNKKLISNILWIKTLLESDQQKFYKQDLSSWMYLRFLSIAKLDPWFYENYLFGGMYLSVIKDDLIGASKIFNLGLEKYPDDYSLIYYNGFNYFYEMGDFEKGYENLKKLKNHSRTPLSLKFVIDKLLFEKNRDFEVAISLLQENLKLTKDESIKQKIMGDIYSLVAERDLDCLNKGKSDCNKIDATGKPYIQKNDGSWKSFFEFRKYKIYRPSFKEK